MARVLDSSGNQGMSATRAFVVDNTPPTTTITGPPRESTVRGIVTVTAVAGDTVGVRSVRFHAGSVLLGEDATAPYSMAWDTTTAGRNLHADHDRL